MACRVPPRRGRIHGGAVEPAAALAAAVPLVLRDASGDVEAPTRRDTARHRRTLRPPRSHVPALVPGHLAVGGTGGGRLRDLRRAVSAMDPSVRGLVRLPRAAVRYRGVRVPSRP